MLKNSTIFKLAILSYVLKSVLVLSLANADEIKFESEDGIITGGFAVLNDGQREYIEAIDSTAKMTIEYVFPQGTYDIELHARGIDAGSNSIYFSTGNIPEIAIHFDPQPDFHNAVLLKDVRLDGATTLLFRARETGFAIDYVLVKYQELTLRWDSVCTDIDGNPTEVIAYRVTITDELGMETLDTFQTITDPETCEIRVQKTAKHSGFDPDLKYTISVQSIDNLGRLSEKSTIEVDGACIGWARHDINRDGRENLVDIITMIYVLFHAEPYDCNPRDTFDFNDDNFIDISDIVTFIQEMFSP